VSYHPDDELGQAIRVVLAGQTYRREGTLGGIAFAVAVEDLESKQA